MLPFLLLTLVGAGMATMVSGGDDEASIDTDNPDIEDVVAEEPNVEGVLGDVIADDIVPEEPEVEEELGDVGATAILDEENNVLTIDIGDDETGIIAAKRYHESVGNCCSGSEGNSLYVYLVPVCKVPSASAFT